MNTKIYVQNERFIAGMTLKNMALPDGNNMALHVTDLPNEVVKNRQRLADYLDVKLDKFVCANQTHSANFYKVTTADQGRGVISLNNAIPDTDALYTTEPNIVLCSFTADCVPVIFFNEINGLIGIVHSGWQGTVKEISRRILNHVIVNEGCNPNDFFVYIGSAISQDKFEVDEDVYMKFHELGYADDFIEYDSQTKKYHIDNQKAVRKQCELEGVPQDQIIIDCTCTFQSDEGFSHREDRGAGRHLSFIMKK